jgi:hydrogenase nickel incorporation protein HypB
MVCAITEGEEKPLECPLMFRSADLVLINEVDLSPHLHFDLSVFLRDLDAVNPGVGGILTSAATGEGGEWCSWLAERAGA